jgi:hypothetical protein
MPFITVPQNQTLSAYRPIQFEVMTTGSATGIPQNAIVDLYFNGVLRTTFNVKPSRTAPSLLFPGLIEYFFCIDVAERLRDLLAPFAEIPTVFLMDCPTAPANNVDSIGEFYLDVTYDFLDLTDNLIKPQIGFNDISNLFFAANITRQNLEDMFLNEFTDVFPTLGRPLTNSPLIIDTCRTDNLFLSYLVESAPGPVNGYQIVLFDSVGGTIGTAEGFLGSSPLKSEIFTFNAGIENGLKCLVNFQETAFFDLDDPNIACYTIQAGFLNLGLFFPGRQLVKYNISNTCKCCENFIGLIVWGVSIRIRFAA